MKTRKPSLQLHWKQEVEDLILDINEKYPIRLKGHEDLINRIYTKYPYVKKPIIIGIVVKIFETMRECLIRGEILNIRKGFTGFQLMAYCKRYKGKIYPALKTRMNTPKEFDND